MKLKIEKRQPLYKTGYRRPCRQKKRKKQGRAGGSVKGHGPLPFAPQGPLVVWDKGRRRATRRENTTCPPSQVDETGDLSRL